MKSNVILRDKLIELLETQNPEAIGSEAHEAATVGLTDMVLQGILALGYDVKKEALIFFECSECPKWNRVFKKPKLKKGG